MSEKREPVAEEISDLAEQSEDIAQVEVNKAPQEKPSQVKILAKRWFIDAFSGMAMGLFATLIAGTILGQIAKLIGDNYVGNLLTAVANIAKSAMGAGIGAGIAYSLKCDKLSIFSCVVAGMVGALIKIELPSYALTLTFSAGAPGNPVGAYLCALAAAEICRLLAGKTKLDIIVIPLSAMLVAVVVSLTLCPIITWLLSKLSYAIAVSTMWSPFLMGIVISVVMGILLTMPTSSAAMWIIIVGLAQQSTEEGLLIAGGAALVGCCAQMVGFAVMSFPENGWSGLIAQGLGTSMLQIPNIMKNGKIFIPPIVASAVVGPLATCVFKLRSGTGAGMGTSGLVGIIDAITVNGDMHWAVLLLGIVLLCFVLPALISWAVAKLLRKYGWIKENDLKLDLN